MHCSQLFYSIGEPWEFVATGVIMVVIDDTVEEEEVPWEFVSCIASVVTGVVMVVIDEEEQESEDCCLEQDDFRDPSGSKLMKLYFDQGLFSP